ncbi:hypothetical protein [Clostridium sp. HBUAS56017]|nr:hypothetical protein [Clostridium sp. HBUAS56017]
MEVGILVGQIIIYSRKNLIGKVKYAIMHDLNKSQVKVNYKGGY